MRVLISAGGTGGHIYPALAIISKIKEKEPKSEFLYVGTHNRMEKDIVPKYGIPFEELEMYGFNRKNLFKNFKTVKSLFGSYFKAKKIIKEFKPDIVIGVGGYVTAPVIYAAKNLGIPTLIHEQNTTPGKTNLYLSKYASKIAVSFASSISYFPEYKTVFTGNPSSEEAMKKESMDKKKLGLNDKKKLIIIVMGSLGAGSVNKYIVDTISLFNGKDYEVLFVTGKSDYENIISNKIPTNVKVVPYVDDLVRIMKKADLMVSRAGATTLSEIVSLQIPTILIPSPYVADNHQFKNANDLVVKKAAVMIEEKSLKGDILVRTIDDLIQNEKEIKQIKENLKQFQVKNSSELIYKLIKEMVDNS